MKTYSIKTYSIKTYRIHICTVSIQSWNELGSYRRDNFVWVHPFWPSVSPCYQRDL